MNTQIPLMYKQIISFWFDEIDQKMWWNKDSEFDQLCETIDNANELQLDILFLLDEVPIAIILYNEK